jgi:asparagine synthase (glutamine-hydrolysing)
MCGICGIFGMNDKNLINRMCRILVHRGPDDDGFFFDENIGLGHRRLSIIDLAGGKQPIFNEDESVCTIYNGEIYNFPELRQDLEKKGHRFCTNTDTEIIVHLYEEDGIHFVKKLRGMFAIALWDRDKKTLLLARDPIGIKPLYYTFVDCVLIFASEIKAILEFEAVKRKLNIASLDQYLTYRYVPGPSTMFEDIYRLMPGHLMKCNKNNHEIIRYWDVVSRRQREQSEEYYITFLRNMLEESVRMELISDVPLGAYLSGGIDSSIVVALMSRTMNQPVKTFSVGFGAGEPIDELESARSVSEYLGTDHHEIIARSEDVERLLPRIIRHLDEPIVDPAILPTYLVSELASRHVKVVLTGEGADEIFAGYSDYRMRLKGEKVRRKLPVFIKRNMTRFFDKTNNSRISLYAHQMLDETDDHILWGELFDKTDKKELYIDKLDGDGTQFRETKAYFKEYPGNTLSKMLYVDLKTWLPDDLLIKVDKITMANSIEARVPYLDHTLVEFAMQIPSHLKEKRGVEKYILRKAAEDLLPKETLKRKKHGFTVPINDWITKNLNNMISDTLSESTIKKRGFFKYNRVRHIMDHASNPRYSHQLWALFTLELWHKIYIDNIKPDKL